jgi:hypothetical protein
VIFFFLKSRKSKTENRFPKNGSNVDARNLSWKISVDCRAHALDCVLCPHTTWYPISVLCLSSESDAIYSSLLQHRPWHSGPKRRLSDRRLYFHSMALFRFTNSSPKSTMQKEGSPSHQNTGICMEY